MSSTHRTRKWKLNNPVEYAYQLLKSNAKRRGIEFFITLEEWREWPELERYMKGRGRGNDDLTIDRVKIKLGYRIDNIQILTKRENRKKQVKDYKDKYSREPVEGVPF